VETKAHRTSTILVAIDGKTKLYGSRSEMPPELRERMRKALNSPEAATILIADKRGRGEILRLLRGEPSILKTDGPQSIRSRGPVSERRAATIRVRSSMPAWMRPRWVRALIAFLVPALAGAAFYALLTSAR
jgi:hypothetical protein